MVGVGVGVGVRGNKIDEKEKKLHVDQDQRRIRVGKYEVGKTLGEGNFGKVKFALNLETGEPFALKVLDKNKIIHLNIADQIKREIGSLKLLKHPNVVRLHEVLASKTKIYMVLEYVTGGELFDRIASKGKLSEGEARKIFQQLIDGISYCHTKGVFHRDLKLENILVDAKGNIKISDFGLSALPHHFRDDGLLHTTCGSPNYVAPEVLSNRGYDGVTSDIWSCGVILYVILSGYLPFDDRNLTVLYQKIFKGDYEVAKWISKGAQNLMRKILDPNPISRINIAAIKRDEWFQKDYHPNPPNSLTLTLTLTLDHEYHEEIIINTSDPCTTSSSILINAFQLIGMSSWLDLSGFFEKEDVSERKIRFTSNHYSAKEDLLKRMEDIVTHMGFLVHNKQGRLKVVREAQKNSLSRILLVSAEVFKITPSLFVVELIKSFGDSSSYRQLCEILSGDLGVPRREL